MVTQSHTVLYGICMEHDTCHHYKSSKSTDVQYKTWRAYEDYKWENEHLGVDCNQVMKLDYIGHVQEMLAKALQVSENSIKA